jgi:outer membrane receptor for ferrienterochelin and colicins
MAPLSCLNRGICSPVRVSCLLLPPLLAAAALAQSTTNSVDFAELSLEELGTFQLPNVVGASRHEQTTAEAPSAVSVVARDQIQKLGYRTLADLLNGVRGFNVTFDRSYPTIGIRGVNRPGDFGGRVLLLVDGHRLNEPTYGTLNSGFDFPLDIDLIDRVEVIRGPGSSLYGNNAFLGVINVVTRRGRNVAGTEAAFTSGTFDTLGGRVTYGKTFANGLELLLSGSAVTAAGNERLFYPEYADINNGIAQGLDGFETKKIFGSISWKSLSFEAGYSDWKKDVPNAPFASLFNVPDQWVRERRGFASLKLDHTFENQSELMARIYGDTYQYTDRFRYEGASPDLNVPNTTYSRANWIGAEAQYVWNGWRNHRVTLGGEVRRDLSVALGNYDEDPYEKYFQFRTTGGWYAGFLQDEWTPLRWLTVNAGLRYDHFSTFGGTWNPRLATIISPTADTTWKLLYGQAFRAPVAAEQWGQTQTDKANPDLSPENIRSLEAVWEQKLNATWRASASAYWNRITDLITQDTDPVDGFLVYKNIGSVDIKGAEFEIEGRWAGGWRAQASYALADSTDRSTGESLSNAPQHITKLQLTAPIWRENVFGSLELLGFSQRLTTRGVSASAYLVANATLFARELAPGLEASLSVYNLFDTRYAHVVTPNLLQDTVQQDGRAFRLMLTYKF